MSNCPEYRELLRRRQAELDGGTGLDIPHKLQQLGVPHDAVAAVRQPTQTEALRWAKTFALSPRAEARTLILAGPHGVGKSVGAAWVLAEWARGYDWNSQPSGGKEYPPAVWMGANEITTATEYGKVDPEWLEGCRRCRVLVVDDIGKDATVPGLAALSDLLISRHDKLKATVITSNLAPADLAKRYGDSWLERLKSASLVPDLRREASLRKRSDRSAA